MAKQPLIQGGNKYWYNHKGQLHRLDGPAIETLDGYSTWYLHGMQHRVDGPAREWRGLARKEYFLLGQRHRIGGPAYIPNHYEGYWYEHGLLHRLDGPAWDTSYSKQYYVRGQRLLEYEFLKRKANGTLPK